ncbi:unnamed protein product [Ambrosiozyma monospora]|uniref:Unnamed protein product n=1 Tax=Ambrosiozyma monospora TaxID=43982 RepID=A0ACB5U961_AMBMO|nr:unnamed protein product [Ambrosiozyma monospora]
MPTNYQEQLSELVQNAEDEENGELTSSDIFSTSTATTNNTTTSNIIPTINETTSLLPSSNKKKYATTNESNVSNGKSTDYRSLMFNRIPYYVEDLTEVNFTTSEMSSAMLNLPIPLKNRKNETVYFETKLFDFSPETTLISVGLATSPYPNFQLPGLSPYSVGIQSDGSLRLSGKPFLNDLDLPVILPQMIEGDVIGIGYKTITGSVFITHNGKNILEIVKNFRAQLYPCIGSVGGPCKVTCNFGQLGFVFIEANVKKLGFCENHNEGSIGAPPL